MINPPTMIMATDLDTEQQILWQRVKQDDATAFRHLYAATVVQLSNQCHRILHDADAVKDVLQEVYTSLYLRRAELPDDLNVGGYLNQAIRFKVANQVRNRLRQEQQLAGMVPGITATIDPLEPDHLDVAALSLRVRQAIGSLPEKCRQAFLLSHYEQLSYKRVAAEMGISVKTVEKHVSKALQALRQELREESLLHGALVLIALGCA